MSKLIEIVTAVVRDADGRWLVVRKRGSSIFMKPGGKREPGEDDLTALAREVREELACGIVDPVLLGTFEAPAANEPDTTVRAVVYLAAVDGEPVAQAEIEEVLWLNVEASGERKLARLLTEQVLPAVKHHPLAPARGGEG
ncbi:NUDIX domain-containing protein [Caulobacter segnis]|uniref:NUDIX hydrolase n=1 Tax=Caulobacter segnis TaxID=88688 RepID=UPI00240EB9D9|nr:NUDIX domain-containing protein [Caulobacter segnis]MDG2521909.1 NUDIX domain-containing protein [Caulobacter segnis]